MRGEFTLATGNVWWKAWWHLTKRVRTCWEPLPMRDPESSYSFTGSSKLHLNTAHSTNRVAICWSNAYMSRWWGESTSSLFRRKIWNRKLLFCPSGCSPAASIQTHVKCPWLCTNHAQEQCSSLFKSCIRLWGSLQNQGEVKYHFFRMLVGSVPAPPTHQAPDYGLNLRYSMMSWKLV